MAQPPRGYQIFNSAIIVVEHHEVDVLELYPDIMKLISKSILLNNRTSLRSPNILLELDREVFFIVILFKAEYYTISL